MLESGAVQVVTLQTVMSVLHPLAAKHKSPRVWVASITWMTTAAADFGSIAVDNKAAMGYCKEMLSNTNAGVREAGTEFAALLHAQVPPLDWPCLQSYFSSTEESGTPS